MNSTTKLERRLKAAAEQGKISHNEQYTLLSAVPAARHSAVLDRLREGVHPRFAVMFVMRKAPGIHGTTTGFAAMHRGEVPDETVVAEAKRQGFNPGSNATYFPEYAESVGDPKAFLTGTNDFNDIQNHVRAQRKECDGVVKSKYRPPDKDPHAKDQQLAPDIVRRMAAKMAQADPDVGTRQYKDVAAEIIATHS